jgi:hypothetical protein
MATSFVSNDTAATFGNSPQKTGEPLDHAKLYSGKALEFDGIGDYLNSSVPEFSHANEFTVSCWFKTSATTGGDNQWHPIVRGKAGTSATRFILGFHQNGGTKYFKWMIYNTSDYVKFEIAENYNDGQWHRVVATNTNSTLALYIDGVSLTNLGVNASATVAPTSGEMDIGKNSTYYFNGHLCDLQFWDKKWELSDVTYDYLNPETLITGNASVTSGITTSNLKLWYPMNDTGVTNPQTVIFDAAGTNNTTKNHATTTFLGNELIGDTGFDTAVSAGGTGDHWICGDDWTIGSNIATHDGSDAGGAARNLTSTALGLVQGKQYRITITVGDAAITTPRVKLMLGSGSDLAHSGSFLDENSHSFDATAGGDNDTLVIRWVGGQPTVDDVSVKELGIASGWTEADQQQTIPQTVLMNGSVKSFVGNGLYSNSIPSLSYPFTLSCWVYKTDDVAYAVYLTDKDASNIYFGIALGADDKVYLQASNTTNKNTNSNSTYTNQWVHVVASFESATDRNLYINGSPNTDNENNDSVTYENIDRISVGYMGDSSPIYSGSEIIVDEICVFSTGLNDSEASELYNNGLPLNATKHSLGTTNLVGYWRNNDLHTDGKWKDQVSTNHLTANDTPSTIFFQEGVTANLDTQGFNTNIDHTGSKGAAWFDGASNILDMGKNIEIEGDYMFMFWIKPNHVSTNYVCAGSGSSNYLRIGSATNLFFKSNNVNKSLDLGVSGDGTSIGIAQWHHVAMTRNNGTLKVYFDNIAQDSSLSDTATLKLQYIGARGGASSASHYYDGMIDEFFVYDNFDANTINKNYKHGKSKHSN